jgi:cytochrome oxidase assembly protein ShyY1
LNEYSANYNIGNYRHVTLNGALLGTDTTAELSPSENLKEFNVYQPFGTDETKLNEIWGN